MGVTHSLTGVEADASEDGTGRGTPIIAIGLGSHPLHSTDLAQPITGRNGDPGVIAVRTAQTGSNGWGINEEETSYTLDGAQGQAVAFGVADDTAYSLRANEEGFAESRVVRPHAKPSSPSHSGDKGDGGINTTMVASPLNNPGNGGRTTQVDSMNYLPTPMGVRRLTPTECERLMGWPEAKETVIIEVWKENCGENPKSDAPAGSPSHRSPRPVGSAGRTESPSPVRCAGSSLMGRSPQSDVSVALNVEINLETRVLDVRTSSGESLLHANIADSNGWSRNQKQPSDFAHLAALISSTLARTTLDGRAASVLSRSSSSVPSSGSACVVVSGREIAASVSDAERYINEATRCMKSITSAAGQSSLTSDSILRTLCCCAAHAISGFIPETIRNESSYAFALTIASGHTRYGASGKEMSDSTRYRMCGNGVVSNVAYWIAARIKGALDD
jgi:site-specific DNA-cytosine methylase